MAVLLTALLVLVAGSALTVVARGGDIERRPVLEDPRELASTVR